MQAPIVTTLAASLLVLFTASAAADVRLHYRDGAGQPASDVYVRDGQVRMERTADGFAMLVDTDSGKMTMIDHGRRVYTVMDHDAMSRMRGQMEQMREQMKQQLAALPEQQRKQMEQQMGGMLGGSGAGPEYRETGQQRTVQGRECTVVEATMGGRTLFSACVVPAAALNLPAADTTTLQTFAKVIADNAGSMHGGPPPMALEGVPLTTTDTRSGREETLSAIEIGDVDAALFSVPEGYAEQKMGGPGMGGGMGMPMPQ